MSSTSSSVDAKNTEKQERSLTGRVVSNSMNKTAVIAIERKTAHPVYGKYVKRTTKYYVHDDSNQLNVGDLVKITPSRPLSKLKRWVVNEVLEVANM